MEKDKYHNLRFKSPFSSGGMQPPLIDDKKRHSRRFWALQGSSDKHYAPTELQNVLKEISTYFNEPYGFWVRHTRGQFVLYINNCFEWVKSLEVSKKEQAKILFSLIRKGGGKNVQG